MYVCIHHDDTLRLKNSSHVGLRWGTLGNRRRLFRSCKYGILPRVCRFFKRHCRRDLPGIHRFWTSRGAGCCGYYNPAHRLSHHVSLSGLHMFYQPCLFSVFCEEERRYGIADLKNNPCFTKNCRFRNIPHHLCMSCRIQMAASVIPIDCAIEEYVIYKATK